MSETKDFSSHSNTSRLSAQSHGAMQRAGDACICGRLQYRQGTLSGGNPNLLRTVSLCDLHDPGLDRVNTWAALFLRMELSGVFIYILNVGKTNLVRSS